MDNVFLSVVIPCFDEMGNMQKGVLDKVDHFLQKKGFPFEVIIVDDGSKDGSVEFVQDFVKDNPKFTLVKNSHKGKAGTVTSGMLMAKGKYVLFTDMDQATPINEIDQLLPFFDEGYDIVIGSRSSKRKGAPWTRLLMAKGMMFLRTLVVGIRGVSDTQCGFKMFKNEAAKKIFTKINDMHSGFKDISGSNVSAGFDVELLYLGQKMGYKIKEVPINWLYVETRRVSPIKDSIEGLADLVRIKINSIRGVYN